MQLTAAGRRTRIGDDERLKKKIHEIVFFVHERERFLALAQNNDERLLVVDMHGEVKLELANAHGTEFTLPEVIGYYTQCDHGQVGMVCCYHFPRLHF